MRFVKICGAIAVPIVAALGLSACAQEDRWANPRLSPEAAAAARQACDIRAEAAAGPNELPPRPCGSEIDANARDRCARDNDAAYARLAGRLRARETAFAACMGEAGFQRR
jgi:hypothetical protein